MNEYYMMNDCMFAEQEEILQGLNICDLKTTDCKAGGLVTTMEPGSLTFMVDPCEGHSCCVGGTGSRKTRGIIAPSIVSLALAGENIIVHDPKSDIFTLTSGILEQSGYRIFALNIRDPQTGDQYNPLKEAYIKYSKGDESGAYALINEFATPLFMNIHSSNDPYWEYAAISYFCGLAALLLDLCDSPGQFTLNEIHNLHLQGYRRIQCYLDHVITKKRGKIAQRLLNGILHLPNDTRECVFSIYSSVVTKLIFNDKLVDMLADSSFSVDDFVNHKTALFIINRDETSAYNLLVSSILAQFYCLLVERSEEFNGHLPIRTNFVMDEYQALAPGLQDIGSWVSASRSRNIRLFFAVQSLTQLEYSRNMDLSVGDVILDNISNLVYLYSPSLKTIRIISQMCGENLNNDRIKEPLVSENTLRYLQKTDEFSEALFIVARKHPFFSRLYDISNFIKKTPIMLKTRRISSIKAIDYDALQKEIDIERMESREGVIKSEKCILGPDESVAELTKAAAERAVREELIRKIDRKLQEVDYQDDCADK